MLHSPSSSNGDTIFSVLSFWTVVRLFRIPYWTALLPVQLAARILDKFFTDIMLLAATGWSQRAPQTMVQIRLSGIAFSIHNPHGVVLWAFVDDFARILRLQVRAGRATTFSTFEMQPSLIESGSHIAVPSRYWPSSIHPGEGSPPPSRSCIHS